MIAIDTNVLVYSVDAGDPVKQTKARAAIQKIMASGESAIIPWQVAVEFLARLRKWEAAGQISGPDVATRFDEFLAAWTLAIPSVNLFRLALQLHSRYSLSHWDNLLLAACADAGVTQLLSEDMQSGAEYEGVKFINPFV